MSDARSTYRYAVLLLGGSVLVVGALIASGLSSKASAPAQADIATAENAAALQGQSAFEKWADEGEMAEGKGRLIGEVELDGKMVELRQLPDGVEPGQPDQDLPADEVAAGRGEPAS